MHSSTSVSDCNKPPPLKVRRQRGKRFESGSPEIRRDVALGSLNDRRKPEIDIGKRIVTRGVLAGRTMTADDLQSLMCGEQRRSFIGAIFSGLHNLGVIRPVGWTASTIPKNHSRPVVAWVLGDRAKAEEWLRDHPDPDPLAPPTQQRLDWEAT